MNAKSRATAFTLIELMVVIALMAIMMGIIVSAVSRVETSHEKSETIARLHVLARQLDIYRADYGDVPPYDPTGAYRTGTDPGAGLYALVMLGYLQTPRFLHDAGMGSPVEPWVLSGADHLSLQPDDANDLATAYNAYAGGGAAAPLAGYQLYMAYVAFANPAAHAYGGPALTLFDAYDEDTYENYCSWMMQDPVTAEWKYQPYRLTSTFAVADPTQPEYYRRQLSHQGTDENDPRYLPASDTVVTWSTAFRPKVTQPNPAYNQGSWGIDVVLYADNHVATIPAPQLNGAPPRALQRAVAP
jgi:prepilin-type N-terminal cleavage/methylation domain-containing protein